jgi:dienelactone hydrolase
MGSSQLWAQVNQRASCELQYSYEQFVSHGKRIGAEVLQPLGEHRLPIILFVHGAGGVYTRQLSSNRLPSEQNFGEQRLACGGYTVLIVHYFDSTGIKNIRDKDEIEKSATAWVAALSAGITYVQKRSGVSQNDVALLGESLGGYLSIALAASDQRVACVSEYGGGFPRNWVKNPQALPPILIQHAKNDEVVSVGEAYTLDKLLDKSGVLHELHVFDGGRHIPDQATVCAIVDSSLVFFTRCLARHRTVH